MLIQARAFSLCLCGFSLSTPTSPHSPKDMRARLIEWMYFTLLGPVIDWQGVPWLSPSVIWDRFQAPSWPLTGQAVKMDGYLSHQVTGCCCFCFRVVILRQRCCWLFALLLWFSFCLCHNKTAGKRDTGGLVSLGCVYAFDACGVLEDTHTHTPRGLKDLLGSICERGR